MIKEERFEIILRELEEKTTVSYENLSGKIGVSEDTIRRDIEHLYRNGLLTKVRGGAILRKKDPLSFQDRSSFATDAKNTIALKAQKFIKDGITVFMDGGTTVCAIANHLPIAVSLRIITNNPSLIPILIEFKNIELIVLGGVYHRESGVTVGADTCDEVSKYIADLYFMGTCALDSSLGTSATFKADAEVKRTMAKSSKKIIALADQNKLRRTEPFKIVGVDAVDVLITDLNGDHSELKEFRNLGLQII